MIMGSSIRHKNVLIPSTPDNIALGGAVEERFLSVCKLWMRVNGSELPIPESLNGDLMRWRKMRVRHRGNDFRHTEAESRSVRTIAQWTCDMNCDLRNQERVVIDWGD